MRTALTMPKANDGANLSYCQLSSLLISHKEYSQLEM